MKLRVIYIFSHDSIGLGEDGPTHQPIEQLAGLRAIPNLKVFRPADINETLRMLANSIKDFGRTKCHCFIRQKLPYISNNFSENNKCEKGAYVLNITSHDYKTIIIASGSEVELALRVQASLLKNGINSKVVSMPCQELFEIQSNEYKKNILNENSLIVTIEAGETSNWKKYLRANGISFGIDRFGESAPFKEIYNSLNLSEDKIVSRYKIN